MLLHPFTLYRPETLKEALNLFSSLEDAQILAGGTFLINRLKVLRKKGLKTPRNIISLRKIQEINGITEDKNTIHIGAMTTISEIYGSAILKESLSVLPCACKNLGTTTIRNMATLGGNLTCRYTWTEMPCVLSALDAKLTFQGKDLQKEVIPVNEFFKAQAKTDKILTHISLRKEKNTKAIYKRIPKRAEVDIPLLAVCMKAEKDKKIFKKTRVAINNTTQFVQRDTALEDFLNSTKLEKNTAKDCLKHLTAEIYDTKSDDYKKHIFRVTIKNMVQELMESQ